MTNKDFFIQTWLSEMKRTAAAVRGLPEDMARLDFRSNEKARSAAEIIGHMLPHAEALCNAADSFIANEEYGKTFKSTEEAALYFEKNASQTAEKLKALDDKVWNEQIVEFRVNGNKLFEYPMINIYWMFMFDIIHHRGQLSTYYRNMGVRNPQIYGPTAEDMETMAGS
ncbi:MAG TPA: DinB family protein [Ignavibacteria bacterium]|nr:DinB family protein [Ignavibacteria bacterium]